MLSYRFKQGIRRLISAILVLAILAGLAGMLYIFWLSRFLVYTRHGVHLDLSLPQVLPMGQIASRPTPLPVPDIYFNEGSSLLTPDSSEPQKLDGYYVSAEMLVSDFDRVESLVKSLPYGSTILFDVRSMMGEAYYSTDLLPLSQRVDTQRFDNLIAYLRRNGYRLIARMSALRDYYTLRNGSKDAVPVANRMSLWLDSERCYWYSPAAEGTLTRLISQLTELRLLGFSEVVLCDMKVPQSDAIYYPTDATEDTNTLAQNLVSVCGSSTFTVSFQNADADFSLPEGSSRLYFSAVPAAEAHQYASRVDEKDAPVRVVFLTELMDTRYQSYGVLHPIMREGS